MTPRDLAYWLQGYFEIQGELGGDATLIEPQRTCIQRHINLARLEYKQDYFVSTVQLALDTKDASLLSAVVSNYFEHVLDPQDKDKALAQLIRC